MLTIYLDHRAPEEVTDLQEALRRFHRATRADQLIVADSDGVCVAVYYRDDFDQIVPLAIDQRANRFSQWLPQGVRWGSS